MTSIILVDDNIWFRVRIRTLLDAQPDLNVVAEAAGGEEAFKLVDEFHPDILITDLEMPGQNGFRLIEQVHQRSPETRSIVLSSYGSKSYLKKAIQAGASGYLMKDPFWEDLVPAIRTVLKNGRYYSPSLDVQKSEFSDNGD